MTRSSSSKRLLLLVGIVVAVLGVVPLVDSFHPVSTGLTQQRGLNFGIPSRPEGNINNVQGNPYLFQQLPSFMARSSSPLTVLFGKKSARKAKSGGKGGGGGNKPRGQQQKQEKQSVKDARFDANTRQFMFTMVGLTKMLPGKSKNILNNIHLSFYPGAKIGVVGLNGSVRKKNLFFFFF